jgi:hypothetical protein
MIGAFFCYKEVRPYNQGQSIDILGSNPVEKYLAKQMLRTMYVVKIIKSMDEVTALFLKKLKFLFRRYKIARSIFFWR